MKLTTDIVASLVRPANKPDHIEWDDSLPGFGVRLRGGSKRWIVQYRVGAQQRRESLGDVRKVKLEDARKIARQRFALVELGNDPAAERAKVRQAGARAKLSLANVAARYLSVKQERLRSSTLKQMRWHFETLWAPLANQPLDTVKRADVAARLQEITKAHGRTSAARARSNLSALFAWAMKEGLCEVNPVIATNNPAEGILPRDRVLSDGELAVIWKACADDDFGRIVKLLILTGCRRDEIGGLKWAEIDLDTGILTVPGERTKNHRALVLTLPAVALDILRTAPRRAGRDHVFGGRGGGFAAWSYSKVALDNRIAATEGKPLSRWTLHDCRRTMRTGIGKFGVAPHIAELVIGHIRGGVQAIYDRHKYEREIEQALALWAEHVASILDGKPSKVVAMPARGSNR